MEQQKKRDERIGYGTDICIPFAHLHGFIFNRTLTALHHRSSLYQSKKERDRRGVYPRGDMPSFIYPSISHGAPVTRTHTIYTEHNKAKQLASGTRSPIQAPFRRHPGTVQQQDGNEKQLSDGARRVTDGHTPPFVASAVSFFLFDFFDGTVMSAPFSLSLLFGISCRSVAMARFWHGSVFIVP